MIFLYRGEPPRAPKPSFKLHSSHGALSSSLPIGENPLGFQAIEFFATLSIYKTSIVFLDGQGIH